MKIKILHYVNEQQQITRHIL